MAILTCENTAFSYDGNTVISGLNFTVEAGDYLCIVGENGSGKSTLIKGMLGLLKPQQGTISLGDGIHSNEIGYLPQQTLVQRDFPASVYEVVLSGCLSRRGIHPFYTAADKQLVRQQMERLGISDLRNHCYRELSGGQQQRVLLARALCAADKVLLLDEPVAGLDPLATQGMYDLIAKLNQESGMTIIMVSHDIHSALTFADHILHLQGTQLFFGTREDYLKSRAGNTFLKGEGGEINA